VLPFENSSGDPAQDGIAAGITRDVTDRIAEDPIVPLVPTTTTAVYGGRAPDLRAIGRDHDLHFVLTGNARRQDGRLIVAATFYQTADERPVWAQRFDRPDGPDARDSILRAITTNFDLATMDAEAARAMMGTIDRSRPSTSQRVDGSAGRHMLPRRRNGCGW
jgi:adenylate cyclase